MTRVLIAWEFGGGTGHLTGVCALAALVAQRGHTVTLAVPDPRKARPLLRERLDPGASVELVQGVGWSVLQQVDGKPAGDVATFTLADVMMLFGWDDPGRIGRRVKAWQGILERVKPDVAIADFAPALRLISETRLPLAMMGTGYSLPPGGRLLPPIRPWHDRVVAYSRMNEGTALASVNRVRQALRMPAVDYLADAFHGDRSFPCTVPAFDPYRGHRAAPTLPPHNIEPIEPGPPMDERESKALVHLPPDHQHLREILHALHELGVASELVVRGQADRLPADLPHSVTIRRGHVDLTQRLPRVRLCVHHGGLGLAYAGAMAATPQLLLTERLEHRITAAALAESGAGATHGARDELDAGQLRAELAHLLDEGVAGAARRFARDMPRDGGTETLRRVAEVVDLDPRKWP
jgi:hypothetical protein